MNRSLSTKASFRAGSTTFGSSASREPELRSSLAPGNNQLQALRSALVSLQRRVKEVEAQNGALDAERKELQHETAQVRTEVSRLREENTSLRMEQDLSEKDSSAGLDRACQERDDALEELSQLNSEVAQLNSSKSDMQAKITALTNDKDQLRMECAELQQQVQTEVNARQCKEACLQAACERAHRSEEDSVQLRIRLADQEKKYDQLRNEVQQLDKNCRASTAESDRLKRDSSHKEAALQQVTKQAADAAEERSRLQAELQSLNAQNTDLKTRATMEASNARQAADLSMSMERMHQVLQKEASDQREYFERLDAQTKSKQMAKDYEARSQQMVAEHERKLCSLTADSKDTAGRVTALQKELSNLQQYSDSKTEDLQQDLGKTEQQLYAAQRSSSDTACALAAAQSRCNDALNEKSQLEETLRDLAAVNEELHQQVLETADMVRQCALQDHHHCAPACPRPTSAAARCCTARYLRACRSSSPGCQAAIGKAATIQMRNHTAMSRHLQQRSKTARTTPYRKPDSSVTEKLSRAAAGMAFETAEQMCKHEMLARCRTAAARASFEAEYSALYRDYQELLHNYKCAEGRHRSCLEDRMLHEQIVNAVHSLNTKASVLLDYEKAA